MGFVVRLAIFWLLFGPAFWWLRDSDKAWLPLFVLMIVLLMLLFPDRNRQKADK